MIIPLITYVGLLLLFGLPLAPPVPLLCDGPLAVDAASGAVGPAQHALVAVRHAVRAAHRTEHLGAGVVASCKKGSKKTFGKSSIEEDERRKA